MITNDESSILYAGNGSTVTPYPVPFFFADEEDLTVVVIDSTGAEALLALGGDYTVTGEGDPDGGTLTTLAGVPATSSVSIVRNVPYTQEMSYEEGDVFPAKSHERALDKLTMECQQLARGMGTGTGGADDLGTVFRVTEASSGLRPVPKKADSSLGVDAGGDPILRTSGEMLGWLGQVGTAWLNDTERLQTRGTFAGQTGVQRDNLTIYIAQSTAPGDWVPFIPGTGVVAANNGTPEMTFRPSGELVGTTESQILTNKTLNTPQINNPTGLTKADVGLDRVDNVSSADQPLSTAETTALNLKEDKANKGIATGYASLDGGAKVPLAQLPSEVLGASSYKGTWNATTNSPTIPSAAVGNNGWYCIVSVAGSSNPPGTSLAPWAAGDTVISNGTAWQKIGSTSAVVSVAGRTGVVTLAKGDVSLGNVDNTSDATKNSATATLTNKTINGANNTLTVRLANDVTGNLPTSKLNSGTGAAADTWWCGDGSWKKPPGSGDVAGPASAVDGDYAVFNGTTGKVVKSLAANVVGNVRGPAVAAVGDVAVFADTTGKTIASGGILMPVGAIIDYAGATAPAGWLLCFGQSLARTGTYAALFSAIGTTYGSVNGSTFNVPDLRARVGVGKHDMGGTTGVHPTVLEKTGRAYGTEAYLYELDVSEIAIGMYVTGPGIPPNTWVTGFYDATTITINNTTTADTGSGSPLKFFMLDGLGTWNGSNTQTLSWHEMPSHTHADGSLSCPGSGIQSGYVYSWAGASTGGAGWDRPHLNLQPSIVINKLIKY